MFYVTFISIRLSTIFGTSYNAAYNWSTLPPIVTFASRLHWPSAFTGIRTVWSSRRWREACMPREQPLFILSWKCYSEKTFAFLSTVYNKVDETLARKIRTRSQDGCLLSAQRAYLLTVHTCRCSTVGLNEPARHDLAPVSAFSTLAAAKETLSLTSFFLADQPVWDSIVFLENRPAA